MDALVLQYHVRVGRGTAPAAGVREPALMSLRLDRPRLIDQGLARSITEVHADGQHAIGPDETAVDAEAHARRRVSHHDVEGRQEDEREEGQRSSHLRSAEVQDVLLRLGLV